MRLSALAISAALAVTSASAFAAPVTLKFSHVVAENTPKGEMAQRFEKLVEERIGDKVQVEVYPNSQLYNDNKVLQAMQLGDVQMAAPALSKFSRYTDKLQVFDLPFLFENIKAVTCFQNGEHGQDLLTHMKDKGIVGLGYQHNGMKQLSASDPLRTPDDAADKKFRIMSSDVLAAQFEAVDAAPVKKPFSEVFTLLQTKAIDGQENTWSNIYSQKFYEVQPYITESNHGYLGYMVVTSSDFWGSLEPETREVIAESMTEALEYGNSLANELNNEQKQKVVDSGESEVIEIDANQRGQWVEAMKPVWNEFRPEIGGELIDAAEACEG
ncbi:TRAP transporter substrate-binding protein [Arhodomonas sp. AD133]|uniref:TRAP transporter substrate-binding protein n=1 Tax=Arhodomonas sp. AD133 TaxID=3415009 RepID=UPI003EBF5A39